MTTQPTLHPDTLLIHSGVTPAPGFESLVVPIYQASTVLFDSIGEFNSRDGFDESSYVYGTVHTPTTLALSQRIAQIEGGHNTVLAPSGQSAIHLALMSFLSAGDHILIPDNAYAPLSRLAHGLLSRMQVQVTTYDPLDLADVAARMQTNTRIVWVEAPGSITMEVSDIPAISKLAKAHGALVIMDNTWGAGRLFKAFMQGVDISVQALTKYQGGHSDLVMGSVTTSNHELWRAVKGAAMETGLCVGPHDCALVLRGLQTMAVRMAHVGRVGLELAQWLSSQPGVRTVLHPALPSCPGHEVFLRDFSGSAGLFSIEIDPAHDFAAIERMVAAMPLFKIGASWGGTTSLVLAYNASLNRRLPRYKSMGVIVRLCIGLEDVEDLRANLKAGLTALQR